MSKVDCVCSNNPHLIITPSSQCSLGILFYLIYDLKCQTLLTGVFCDGFALLFYPLNSIKTPMKINMVFLYTSTKQLSIKVVYNRFGFKQQDCPIFSRGFAAVIYVDNMYTLHHSTRRGSAITSADEFIKSVVTEQQHIIEYT